MKGLTWTQHPQILETHFNCHTRYTGSTIVAVAPRGELSQTENELTQHGGDIQLHTRLRKWKNETDTI